MTTIYKPGDRIVTKIKGVEVEASITKVTIDLEVKADDGTLWWRASGRVRPVGEPGEPAPGEGAAAAADAPPDGLASGSDAVPSGESSPSTAAPAGAEIATPPAGTPSEGGPAQPPEAPQLAGAAAPDTAPCGVPEAVAEQKRKRSRAKR